MQGVVVHEEAYDELEHSSDEPISPRHARHIGAARIRRRALGLLGGCRRGGFERGIRHSRRQVHCDCRVLVLG